MLDKLFILLLMVFVVIMLLYVIYLNDELDAVEQQAVKLQILAEKLIAKADSLAVEVEVLKQTLEVYEKYDWDKVDWVWRNKELFK